MYCGTKYWPFVIGIAEVRQRWKVVMKRSSADRNSPPLSSLWVANAAGILFIGAVCSNNTNDPHGLSSE
jgi:hypothetical protein